MEKSINSDKRIGILNTQPQVLALPARCLSSSISQRSFAAAIFKKKSLLIIPTRFKISAVLIVIISSIYSGSSQLEKTNNKETIFVKQLAKYSAQQAQYFSDQGAILVRQVSAVAIADKKQIIPTKILTANINSKEMKPEVKSAAASSNINQKAEDFLKALNSYRQKKGIAPLEWDQKLGDYAQSRADMFNEKKGLDSHAGFNDYIHNQDGFKKLGFYSLGENSGYGHSADPASIIENSYGNSPSHDKNQLNPDWTNVGIGVSGTSTNFIFGGKRM